MDMKKDESRSDPGLVSLLTQLQKALHRRSSEELLGMRLKPYMALGYIRDHPGTTQQELESAMFMDANSVVLMLNELEAAQFSIRRRDPQDRNARGTKPPRAEQTLHLIQPIGLDKGPQQGELN